MRFIPVPDAAKRMYPEAEVIVMLPPDGDMLNDTIRAAEVMLDRTAGGRRMFFVLEDGDLSEIERFKQVYVELFLLGPLMPPVSMILWPDVQEGLKDEVEDSENVEEALIDQLQNGVLLMERIITDYGFSRSDASLTRWLSGAKDTIAKAKEEE